VLHKGRILEVVTDPTPQVRINVVLQFREKTYFSELLPGWSERPTADGQMLYVHEDKPEQEERPCMGTHWVRTEPKWYPHSAVAKLYPRTEERPNPATSKYLEGLQDMPFKPRDVTFHRTKSLRKFEKKAARKHEKHNVQVCPNPECEDGIVLGDDPDPDEPDFTSSFSRGQAQALYNKPSTIDCSGKYYCKRCDGVGKVIDCSKCRKLTKRHPDKYPPFPKTCECKGSGVMPAPTFMPDSDSDERRRRLLPHHDRLPVMERLLEEIREANLRHQTQNAPETP